MYACSLHVYRHMFGLYLLCICVFDAGNLAVLEDVVTRKMRKCTTHASAALFLLCYFFHNLVQFDKDAVSAARCES